MNLMYQFYKENTLIKLFIYSQTVLCTVLKIFFLTEV
jgi:hypothetical protein